MPHGRPPAQLGVDVEAIAVKTGTRIQVLRPRVKGLGGQRGQQGAGGDHRLALILAIGKQQLDPLRHIDHRR
ncbi:hypothetical protein G6F60_015261 [Rhizopus arrhizus]|nr:hypothetical protein G6F60_015261 [Rhizopus arrhizus]